MASCLDCHFFVDTPDTAEGDGRCRRFPPTISFQPGDKVGETTHVAAFPPTRGTNWCGEWRGAAIVGVSGSA